MERLVFNHIYPVVSPQINSAQYGFMKHRSTTTQLIDTYSDISRDLDSGHLALAVTYCSGLKIICKVGISQL